MHLSKIHRVILFCLFVSCSIAICDSQVFGQATNASSNAKSTNTNQEVKRILFLGNSITLHAPAPDIGWLGNWGMAASSEEKDYVHRFIHRQTTESGNRPEFRAVNIANFERQFTTIDLDELCHEWIEWKPDWIVVAIGENVADLPDMETQNKFHQSVTKLIQQLQKGKPQRIAIRSCFWPHAVKDKILHDCAAETKSRFVNLSPIIGDAKYQASAERKIEHAGVAGHPGDLGMQTIADAIYAVISKD